MPRPAEIRLIGDESQAGDDRAHRDDEAVLLANAAREYDWRQAPDQHPRSPVERPCELSCGPSAIPPPRGQVQQRKLEIDGQVDAEPEERFDERISLLKVVEAVAGVYGGYTGQPNCKKHGNYQRLRLAGRDTVRWQKQCVYHRGGNWIREPEA